MPNHECRGFNMHRKQALILEKTVAPTGLIRKPCQQIQALAGAPVMRRRCGWQCAFSDIMLAVR